MSSIQPKTTRYAKKEKQDYKKHKIETNPHMAQLLKLSRHRFVKQLILIYFFKIWDNMGISPEHCNVFFAKHQIEIVEMKNYSD